MKNYKQYMDNLTASDTLREKLDRLEAPKRASGLKKYGTLAAALVLVLGLGAWGMLRGGEADFPGSAEAGEHIAEIMEPAIEPAPDPMPHSPGMEMMGGYELNYGETVAYFMLPLIEYEAVTELLSADMALPVGVTRRDLTPAEIETLFGGASVMEGHLNWTGYTVYAHAMVWPGESLWLLCVSGIKGDTGTEYFTLEVMPGTLPPSCIVGPKGVSNNIWEREVWAECYEGEGRSAYRVSFLDRGYGYRFQITGADAGTDVERVSRLVRWILVGDGLTFGPAESAEPTVGGDEMTTAPYDPNADEPSPTPTTEP